MGQYDEFARLLNDFRERRKLNQRDIAKECNISQGYVSQIHSGNKKPSKNVVDCLATALKLTPADRTRFFLAAGFIEGEDNQTVEIVASDSFQSVLSSLSDPMLNNLPGPLAEETVVGFSKGWLMYAQAKEKQYKREWKAAEELCKKGLFELSAAADSLEAHIFDALGSAALHRGNLTDAELMFKKAESLLASLNDPYIKGQILAHQGEVFRFRSEWNQAEEKFTSANQTFLKIEDKTKCAWIDKKLGLLYLMQSRWDMGIRKLEESEEVFRKSKNTYELAKTCIALGWGYTQKGDWEKALQYRLEGYELSQKHLVMGEKPDEFLQMQGHVYLGLSLHQLGLLDEAQQHLETAKKISDKLEEVHERSTILVGLARLYTDMAAEGRTMGNGWRKRVEDYSETAARETKNAGDQRRYGRTLIYQAFLNIEPGSADRALDLLVEARRIFGVLNHHYYLATVATYMGKAYLMTQSDEYDVYDSLNYSIDTGIKEARMLRIPYYRQLSELEVLQARLACSRSEYNECAKHLADALADAVLFNRFQCEKIADQVVEAIAHEKELKTNFQRWGGALQRAFSERMGQDKKSSGTSKDREKLIQDVITWLNKLRENTNTTFPKRPIEEIRRTYLINK